MFDQKMRTLPRVVGITLLLAFSARGLHATTWDEPWQQEIIADSDAIVRVKITNAQPERVEFSVLNQISGQKLPDTGALVGFSKLKFGSYSVKEDVFRFKNGAEYYLFLETTEKTGEYKIATPTAGYAPTKDGETMATYRHSYHQAYVPDKDYEMSMQAIFGTLKEEKPDLSKARDYIKREITKQPAGIPEQIDSEEFRLFCTQHVALEMLYYIGGADAAQLEPFLRNENPHTQISAVRALGRIPKAESAPRLLAFIQEKDRNAFAKVMAVWALRNMEATDAGPELMRILQTTEDQEAGFGGNIMDPRIGTRFPKSVHTAISEVLASWKIEIKQETSDPPATTLDSKPEGNEKPKPESKEVSQYRLPNL